MFVVGEQLIQGNQHLRVMAMDLVRLVNKLHQLQWSQPRVLPDGFQDVNLVDTRLVNELHHVNIVEATLGERQHMLYQNALPIFPKCYLHYFATSGPFCHICSCNT
jgi:hypothetical protein